MPIIEPTSALPSLALGQTEADIENLSTDGSNTAINFAGMINGYRTEEKANLTKWDARLYRIAENRAFTLASHANCLSEAAQTSDSISEDCDGLTHLQRQAKVEGYSYQNILETSFVAIDEFVDFEQPVQAWSVSDDHKSIFSNKNVKDIGAAVVRSGNAIIYVAILANEKN